MQPTSVNNALPNRSFFTLRGLAWTTVFFTYILMAWGNTVSATGSGLACPDWPLCHGSIFPPLEFEIILEWGHRLLAFVTGLLILATALVVWRSSKINPALKGVVRTLLILLVFQIVLGGTTVLLGLSIVASTVHLVVANLVFGGIITVACAASSVGGGEPVVRESSSKLQRLTVITLAALLIQFILGAVVRHGHAGLACPNFPSCGEEFFPNFGTFEPVLAFLHRWWGILMLGVFVHLEIAAKKTARSLVRVTQVIVFIAFTQVGLGIGTVLSLLDTSTRAAHAALGYGLWGLTFYLALRCGALRWLWQKT